LALLCRSRSACCSGGSGQPSVPIQGLSLARPCRRSWQSRH